MELKRKINNEVTRSMLLRTVSAGCLNRQLITKICSINIRGDISLDIFTCELRKMAAESGIDICLELPFHTFSTILCLIHVAVGVV